MDVEKEVVIPLEGFENQDDLLGSEEIVEDFNILQESLDLEASENPDNKAENKHIKLVKIPLARIKTLIKTDPDVSLASHDALVLIAKATVRYEVIFRKITKAQPNFFTTGVFCSKFG